MWPSRRIRYGFGVTSPTRATILPLSANPPVPLPPVTVHVAGVAVSSIVAAVAPSATFTVATPEATGQAVTPRKPLVDLRWIFAIADRSRAVCPARPFVPTLSVIGRQ